jgi:hypothetical protein
MAITFAMLFRPAARHPAALKQNTVWDYLGMSIAIFGVSARHCSGRFCVDIRGYAQMVSTTGRGRQTPFILGFFLQY